MKLSELEPQFHRYDSADLHPAAPTLAEAQGMCFICPKCQEHSILVWFRGRGVPDDASPGPGRWDVSGTGFDDLTLSPSINVDVPGKDGSPPTGCRWHGFITGGICT